MRQNLLDVMAVKAALPAAVYDADNTPAAVPARKKIALDILKLEGLWE